jgi:hypothetical protein
MTGAKDNGQVVHLQLDVNRFTLAELEDLEDATGMTFTQLGEKLSSGDYSIKLLRAVVWILRRRDEPGYSLEQAREVQLSDIVFEQAPANREERRAAAKRGERRPPV